MANIDEKYKTLMNMEFVKLPWEIQSLLVFIFHGKLTYFKWDHNSP
jgi:hypothetical protein